ncbi:glycosyltransferase family 2 protein [Tessaracoccus palaemonis]|uniref:Glycosyltransferase family 2 protein n=1 Tax=Tessaracoccus palaemonis TaxID=2829499 RepID=A0ABX8SI46_9ACTN|nr:glycosyltransferase family 2 protein [Tessaracoccus palaemonis]QXT62948.1 glycosyltransferase family 2 protein [Tessaracoccus palaemonis]
MTLASVVIPSRGGADRLPRLLAALTAQVDPEWEAVVVLDGDVDGSEEVVAAHGDTRVRSIVFPENRGRVAALNAGFAETTGDVLIRCDDDLEPGRDYITHHKAAHETEQGGAVGLCRNRFPDTPYARVYGIDADARFQHDAYRSTNPWRYWAANVSVPREVWDRVGPYDADYRAYGWEDVDWGYRLHEAGYPVRLVRELEVPHFGAASTTVSRVDRAFHSGAARRLFEAKHGRAALGAIPAPGAGLWGALVWASTLLLRSRTRLLTTARAVDTILRGLPTPIGRKLVALLVESSAQIGYAHPAETSHGL